MENLGIITGSRLLVKPKTLGLDVCAFIGLTLSEPNKYSEVIDRLSEIPEIVECHFVTGKYSLFIKIYCEDHEHLMEILIKKIQDIPYIAQTETLISLEQAIERQIGVRDEACSRPKRR